MKTQSLRASPWAALLCGACLLTSSTGCILSARHGMEHVVGRHLAVDATSYNMAIEQTQNEMLLLNVIRAMNRYPLYITDASKVTGTVKSDLSLGLQLPFGHTANVNKFLGAPTLDVSTSPSVDVNLLNQKDFMTGFLKPVSPDLFAYYWKQGWPAEMVLYLFVLRADRAGMDKCEATKEPCSFFNHPGGDSAKDLNDFANWVHEMTAGGRPVLKEDPQTTNFGPPLTFGPLTGKDLAALEALAKDDGVSLVPDTPANKDKAADREKTIDAGAKDAWRLQKTKKNQFLCPKSQPDCKPASRTERTTGETTVISLSAATGHQFDLTLRSPEGILYYLGELARMATGKQGTELMIHSCDDADRCDASKTEPLFALLTGDGPGKCASALSAQDMDGKTYFIPRGDDQPKPVPTYSPHLLLGDASTGCTPGRSMHALSLVSQLIGLQKSATDFSTTSTIKVVGQ